MENIDYEIKANLLWEQLIKVRKAKIKQSDLRSKSGLSIKSIYNIEHRIGDHTLVSFIKYADSLGMEVYLKNKDE